MCPFHALQLHQYWNFLVQSRPVPMWSATCHAVPMDRPLVTVHVSQTITVVVVARCYSLLGQAVLVSGR